MAENFISRGFVSKRRVDDAAHKERIPPGQYETRDFPVLSAGPTPQTQLDRWTFSINGEIAEGLKLTWNEFLQLPSESITVDIHCVTKWTKLDTKWKGVAVETLLEKIDLEGNAEIKHLIAYAKGGYTTNIPLTDVLNKNAWVVYEYDGKPLTPEHGGPARLLVPHLYFWKSAKWIESFKLVKEDRPGFWESAGYHNYGDPWKEQRYAGD